MNDRPYGIVEIERLLAADRYRISANIWLKRLAAVQKALREILLEGIK